MVKLLKDCVISGELNNSRWNSIQGFIVLRDRNVPDQKQHRTPQTICIALTGNFDGCIQGRHFRFSAAGSLVPESSEQHVTCPAELQSPQIGVIVAAALRRVRVPMIPGAECVDAIHREPHAPARQRPCLHLEWSSQNGRIVLNLIDPQVEFYGEFQDSVRPDASLMTCHDVTELPCDPAEFTPEPHHAERRIRSVIPDDIDDDWRLISDDSEDRALVSLLPDDLQLPQPDDLRDDAAAWRSLRILLSHLASLNIAFDMCRHFCAMDAYRLLIERLLPEATVLPGEISSGFVMHLATWEHCLRCSEEFEDLYLADPQHLTQDDSVV
jgi:hypothetical protein